MLLGTVLFAALVLYDVLLSLQVIDGHMALARPGLLVLLVAMVTLMINRFTGAMTELDRGAETLKIRTTQMEEQLRLADQELREEREFAILARERARLMRDLHDGLGGEMVAVLALAERDGGKVTDIAYHARAALADMRLTAIRFAAKDTNLYEFRRPDGASLPGIEPGAQLCSSQSHRSALV